MVLTTDRERLKTLLIETITLLCKNGLDFHNEFSVDALIGITLDQNDVFLVSIKETVKSSYDNSRSGESGPSHKEKEGEQLSDVSLHSEFSHADLPAITTPQVTSDCQINFDHLAVNSIENDPRASSLSAAVSQRTNPGRKNFSGAASLPKDCNRLPIASTSSPLVDDDDDDDDDDDVSDLEDVVPIVSSQKDIVAPDEEPPRKRQCSVEPELRKKVHGNTDSQEAIMQDIFTQCKSEPLDVIKLENSPVDESCCSVGQDNSNFLYNAVCNNEGNARFDPAFMNLYGQENVLGPSAVPGCSSWAMNASPVSSKGLHDQASGWSRNHKEAQALFSSLNWKKDENECANRGRSLPLAHLSSSVEVKKFPFKCTLCDKQVKLLRDLRAHMSTKHNLEKDFACQVCGSQFTYKHNLLCHLRTVHGLK